MKSTIVAVALIVVIIGSVVLAVVLLSNRGIPEGLYEKWTGVIDTKTGAMGWVPLVDFEKGKFPTDPQTKYFMGDYSVLKLDKDGIHPVRLDSSGKPVALDRNGEPVDKTGKYRVDVEKVVKNATMSLVLICASCRKPIAEAPFAPGQDPENVRRIHKCPLCKKNAYPRMF